MSDHLSAEKLVKRRALFASVACIVFIVFQALSMAQPEPRSLGSILRAPSDLAA